MCSPDVVVSVISCVRVLLLIHGQQSGLGPFWVFSLPDKLSHMESSGQGLEALSRGAIASASAPNPSVPGLAVARSVHVQGVAETCEYGR